jgi:serine/threonine protein kinase
LFRVEAAKLNRNVASFGEGDQVGPYVIEEQLAVGGMGAVFKARRSDGGLVALKLIKRDLAADRDFRRRFRRESQAATKVKHRHIVSVVDQGEHDGIPYLAQEFIEGGTLADRIVPGRGLDLEHAVLFCLQVAKGLDAIHRLELVHRDVKPANILLDRSDRAYLTDFGLAKDRDASMLTQAGQTVGSMDYMAPEQIRGEAVSPRTDIYSLGCVTYECLCGRPPFGKRDGRMAVLFGHLQDEPADPCAGRPEVPDDVTWAIMRALEKEAEKRPPTATAYARMIQVAAGVPPISPGRTPSP